MPPGFQEAFKLFKKILYSEAFSATTTAAGIGIIEIKTFAIQSVTEFKLGIYEV